jgi:signal transduction histidine kinase
LLNLFSNAHKYTSQGTVTLYAEHLVDQGAVLIGITDTGGGIDPAQVDKLFQRFQQMDKNRERRRLGTGLGLAICLELVEMHGGRIWLDNHPGQGADFKFTLPTR